MAPTVQPKCCPSCGDFVGYAPMLQSLGPAFVRLSILREDQAMRGDLVMGGDNGFIARVYICAACGFVGFHKTADAPAGSGGASISLGGGASVTSR